MYKILSWEMLCLNFITDNKWHPLSVRGYGLHFRTLQTMEIQVNISPTLTCFNLLHPNKCYSGRRTNNRSKRIEETTREREICTKQRWDIKKEAWGPGAKENNSGYSHWTTNSIDQTGWYVHRNGPPDIYDALFMIIMVHWSENDNFVH
jgi:hypothetical protein